jgi:CBS domain containing-hemolysin-like protein
MIQFLALVSALGLSFVALVEMAFTLLMRLPQRLEAERESEGALDAYLDDPIQFFIPARVMRGLLLISGTIFGAQLVDPGWVGGLTLFAGMFFVIFGLGQILPSLVVRWSGPERILNLLLPGFTIVANVISPLTALVTGRLGPREHVPARASGSHAGEAAAARPQADAQHDPEGGEENQLLRSVVDFRDTLVREVMTPRPDIVAIRKDATIDDLRRLIQEQEYSRLPVYTDSLDNIVGLVVVKDLIQVAAPLPGMRPVTDIMRPAAFVPDTKRLMDLLREFRQKRLQLAIVVDEYGGTAGLVTVEDVVEELVGEIRDEYDSEAEPIVREADDTYVLSAKVAIEDMVDRLGVSIDGEGFETVGGYVLAQVGRVPAVGERFTSDGLEVEVLEAERRRVHKVRIRRLAAPAASGT